MPPLVAQDLLVGRESDEKVLRRYVPQRLNCVAGLLNWQF
jgi:hypothetical protein